MQMDLDHLIRPFLLSYVEYFSALERCKDLFRVCANHSVSLYLLHLPLFILLKASQGFGTSTER